MKHLFKIKNPITNFFIKLAVLAAVWQSCYIFLLKPIRIPDKWITNIITAGSALLIKAFFSISKAVSWTPVANQPAAVVQENGKNILLILDGCNGLDLMLIYLAFIILLPYPLKRKIIFGSAGIFVILLSNIIRCVALYWIYVHYNKSFDFNHHYVFTILMYLVIFAGWLLFIRKQKIHEAI
jgi:exosortase/archaeosortase family protein